MREKVCEIPECNHERMERGLEFSEREITLFRAFTNPSKPERYEALLSSKKGRNKVRSDLDHFRDLDDRHCRKLAAAEQNQASISALLRDLGAPEDCYVVSSNVRIDGKVLPLDQALDSVVGKGFGTFLCLHSGNIGLL